MFWNLKADMYRFKLDMKIIARFYNYKLTKSEALSIIFDPLGFLANLAVRSRIIMQNIWASKVRWNDLITDELFAEWKEWLTALTLADKCELQRCTVPTLKAMNAKAQFTYFATLAAKLTLQLPIGE